MQAEAAAIAESVEHPAALCESRHDEPVIALIEVVTGLLSFRQIDLNVSPMFLDDHRPRRRWSAQGSVLKRQMFELPDASFRAEDDPFGLKQFHEQIGEHFPLLCEGQARELHD